MSTSNQLLPGVSGLQQILSSYTPAQLTQALQAFQGGQNTQMAAGPLPSVPTSTTASNQAGLKKKVKQQKKPKIIVPRVSRLGTRPLNSWIAFRSYYSVIFESLQQKDISGFLTYLWQTDPFKAKWSILAKAYSIIRDTNGKAKAPLDMFLALNGPYIGIVKPSDYLSTLGWEIATDENGNRAIVRHTKPDASSFSTQLLTTNLSVQDIIQHSYENGYIPDNGGKFQLDGPVPSMTMASVSSIAQPSQDLVLNTTPTLAQMPGSVFPSQGGGHAAAAGFPSNNSQSSNNVQTVGLPHPLHVAHAQATSIMGAQPTNTVDSSFAYNGQSNASSSEAVSNLGTSGALQISEGPSDSVHHDMHDMREESPDIDLAMLAEVTKLATSGDEFPFNGQFTPDNMDDLFFEPFLGSDFNPFDLGQFINMDMLEN
ncbi:MAG: hypothetical protein M1819_000831 [Sarea resinae]|nr:MAG: hypothetical protein M1819_000831 [Sarea resinae]